MAGIKGLTGHINGFLPSGESFSGHYGGDLGTVSNIEFYNSARIFEAWLQQDFLDGKFSIRAGSLALDEEFAGSEYSSLFLNSSFGADTAMSANMPVPIFAITAPGVRLKVQATESLYVQAAIYDGNPAPGFFGDPSIGSASSTEFNRHGTDWSLRNDEGSLWIVEAGYVVNAPGEAEEAPAAAPDGKTVAGKKACCKHDGKSAPAPKAERGLFGSYKLGYARHTDSFADFGALSRGALRNKGSNSVIYGVVDQEIWREAGTEDQGLGLFARAMFAPEAQNTVDYAFEAGVVYKGLIPGRDEDSIGLGYAHIHISDDFAALAAAPGVPNFDHEGIIELTYSAQITPWLAVQPDVQYIIHPGASNAQSDEWAVGLRASIAF
jgi:porin